MQLKFSFFSSSTLSVLYISVTSIIIFWNLKYAIRRSLLEPSSLGFSIRLATLFYIKHNTFTDLFR